MVLFKLFPFFAPLLSGISVWLVLRHRDFETRRKRTERLLVLMPIVVPVLLFIFYFISR